MRLKTCAQRRSLVALWSARDGIAAVEFALVSSFLIILFTGVISFGIGIYLAMQVQNAARAGAAYASTHAFDKAATERAAQDATILGNKVTASATKTVLPSCITEETGIIVSAGSALLCLIGGAPAHYVTVETEMSYALVLPLPKMKEADKTMILRGKSIARVP